MAQVRNACVIAHVDHGKTTLLDGMLKQSGIFRANQEVAERVMDSMDQERERGITILSKVTALDYQDTRINMVDTPGHADFGGEVERVLKLVDAALLLVDACEGSMPQTRFVLQKALQLGLRIIVVVNKIDRDGARPDEVLNEVFDLFCALGANDEQLDFPMVYASAKEGYAIDNLGDECTDLGPLFKSILKNVPAPVGDPNAPLQAQTAILDYDDYLGRIGIGRVYQGEIRRGDRVIAIRPDGEARPFKVSSLMGFLGLNRVDLDKASVGDMVAIAGAPDITVGDTICSPNHKNPLPAIEVDPPTITMMFRSNDSPFTGLEGKFVTSRHIRNRLRREAEHNVSLLIEETDDPEVFRISGRGVLHLGVFVETLRREGYELQVGAPEVITRENSETGALEEPYEHAEIQVAQEYSGGVIEVLGQRGGRMDDMQLMHDGTSKLKFSITSRGLMGYRSQFLTDTRGTGVFSSIFSHYGPKVPGSMRKSQGFLIAQDVCDTVGYALNNLQERGTLFVDPGLRVYGGQVIGLNAKDRDLIVNPGKQKKLSNVRASGTDEAIRLTPPWKPSLEQTLELLGPDEYAEFTPKSIRIRKRVLDHSERRKYEKGKAP